MEDSSVSVVTRLKLIMVELNIFIQPCESCLEWQRLVYTPESYFTSLGMLLSGMYVLNPLHSTHPTQLVQAV